MDRLSEATGRWDCEESKLDCRLTFMPHSLHGSVNTGSFALTPNHVYLWNGPHVFVLESHSATNAVRGARGPARCGPFHLGSMPYRTDPTTVEPCQRRPRAFGVRIWSLPLLRPFVACFLPGGKMPIGHALNGI